MIKLNENIRFVRKQLNLTQDQFAQKLDIKRSLVGAYEEGRAEPSLELLQKMAAMAGISVDILIGRELSQLKDYERKSLNSKELSHGHEAPASSPLPRWLSFESCGWRCRSRKHSPRRPLPRQTAH